MTSTTNHICRPSALSADERVAMRAEEALRRQANLLQAKKRDGILLGPVVLGIFMFCILCNCLFYIYHQTTASIEPASRFPITQPGIANKYKVVSSVLNRVFDKPATPAAHVMARGTQFVTLHSDQPTWHRVAAEDDVDYLRIALRTGFVAQNRHMIRWSNPTNGHHGTVTLSSDRLQASAYDDSCRRFQIERQDRSNTISDQVDFCADGVIRQAVAD